MIVLVGFMGAGKTSVGRLLAARLDVPFRDSDEVVEAREGRAVREIFAVDGEAEFRRLEREAIASLLDGPDAVVALGGGAVEDGSTRTALSRHTVVYLRAGLDDLKARVGEDPSRPMLRRGGVEELYRRRLPHYERVADAVVDACAGPPEEVAEAVVRLLGGRLSR